MSRLYYRPIPTLTPSPEALRLADGWVWFDRVEVRQRGGRATQISTAELPDGVRARLCAARSDIAGLSMAAPRIMGILNTTPDSFSDGGLFDAPAAARAQAEMMIAHGADILDIGGESTRPGAQEVAIPEEISRTAPVIADLRARGVTTPISIDTRKAVVAEAAIDAGANLINDVAAFGFDPGMALAAHRLGVPACLMHAQGAPETMQDNPHYEDVLFDVYDALEGYVQRAEAAGIARADVLVDPGIGFGKTLDHNIALLRGLSLFHALGCAILLGASRKRFIGTLSGTDEARERVAGSLAVALHGVAQGVQVLRVHDVKDTHQALALWQPLARVETG
ncbi:MAG: dihydropteroate synthase [Pseudomonadota bacterium]